MILNELPNILNDNLHGVSGNLSETFVKGINTDSRTVGTNEIFVALKGEKFDGHFFLENAINQGAIALIVNQEISVNSLKKIPQIIVKDTLTAYQQIANWWRNQFNIPIIGITGSVGKTTTKELIAAVLGVYGEVHKTQANYNNEIGVPKT
ncbi:MAG: Mur ligase domain-containing protein, partial [Crocosphaera sp.]